MQSGRRQHVCASAPRLSRSQAGAAASLICLLLAAPLPAQTAAPLPVLRTAHAAHSLRFSEAAREYPVHLARAQVTFYQPDLQLLFLRDSTGGIFANLSRQPSFPLHSGDLVSVNGVTGSGKFSPVLSATGIRLLGHAALPNPGLASFDRILSGAVDSQWIAVRGIVRSVRPIWNQDIAITLASGPDRIDVVTPLSAIPNAAALIDTEVVVNASAGANFNDRGQIIGTFLFMPDLSCLHIEEPAADPFSRPARRVEDVMRPGSRGPGHRIHLRGVVTSTWGPLHFSLMGPEHGIFVTMQYPQPLNVGDLIDVAGFPTIGDYTAVLEDSSVRHIGSALPPPPVHLTAQEALSGTHDAETIEVDGDLLDRSRDEKGIRGLLLSSGGVSFLALLPPGPSPDIVGRLVPGSHLRIRGICLIHAGDDNSPQELNVLLRSPADVVLLQRPSWWTAHNTLRVALVLALLVLVAAAWNLLLRRRVRSQTRTIRQQLDEAETLRRQAEAAHKEKSDSLASVLSLQRELIEAQKKLRYQATHDALTGLWNRRALLDLLEKELERCCRTNSSMGILMLDVDHFKPVNDSLGHLAGDEVLKEVAHRIANATRGYDLSGRYGGEEFLIILPGCDREQTEASAERIRSAVSSTPIEVANTAIALTVSIGATVAPEYARSESEILALADIALYQAKASGRNRTSLRRSFREDRAEA